MALRKVEMMKLEIHLRRRNRDSFPRAPRHTRQQRPFTTRATENGQTKMESVVIETVVVSISPCLIIRPDPSLAPVLLDSTVV
jgi:hypothetical protein